MSLPVIKGWSRIINVIDANLTECLLSLYLGLKRVIDFDLD